MVEVKGRMGVVRVSLDITRIEKGKIGVRY
jgi:hypothetical protein